MAATVSNYVLTVTVDKGSLPILKEGGYRLCLARLVNGIYNVVWLSIDPPDYAIFPFTDGSGYMVFGAESAVPGHRVVGFTGQSYVQYGQTSVLDRFGTMSAARGAPNRSRRLGVVNHHGQVYMGVSAYTPSGGFDPVYVTTMPVPPKTVAEFAPASKLLLFFSNTLSTSMVFDELIPSALEVDFTTGVPQINVTYKGTGESGTWTGSVPSVSLPGTYDPQRNMFVNMWS